MSQFATNTTSKSRPKDKERLEDKLPTDAELGIPGPEDQKFVVMSFLDPDDILKKREHYFFSQFVSHWEFATTLTKYEEFFAFLSHKHRLPTQSIMDDFRSFVEDQRASLETTSIPDQYRTFLDRHEDALFAQFNKDNDFQTSVRGIKIRGVYDNQQDAETRGEEIQAVDTTHNISLGVMGAWMPWNPVAYKTGRVKYLEPELNRLEHEKCKNDALAKAAFDKRVQDAKEKAVRDNAVLAEANGNVLTQTMDEEGNIHTLSGLADAREFMATLQPTDGPQTNAGGAAALA